MAIAIVPSSRGRVSTRDSVCCACPMRRPSRRQAIACSDLRIALCEFEWNKAARDAGVRDGALYLIRPDGYIGLADTEADVSRLRGYLARFDLQVVD